MFLPAHTLLNNLRVVGRIETGHLPPAGPGFEEAGAKRRPTTSLARRGAFWASCPRAKHQLAKRLTVEFLHHTLDAFHHGDIDPDTAAQLLSVSRARRASAARGGVNLRRAA